MDSYRRDMARASFKTASRADLLPVGVPTGEGQRVSPRRRGM